MLEKMAAETFLPVSSVAALLFTDNLQVPWKMPAEKFMPALSVAVLRLTGSLSTALSKWQG
jgi:hypothetical protein